MHFYETERFIALVLPGTVAPVMNWSLAWLVLYRWPQMFALSHPDALAVLPATYTDEGFTLLKPAKARLFTQQAAPLTARSAAAPAAPRRPAPRKAAGGGRSVFRRLFGLALLTGAGAVGVQVARGELSMDDVKSAIQKAGDAALKGSAKGGPGACCLHLNVFSFLSFVAKLSSVGHAFTRLCAPWPLPFCKLRTFACTRRKRPAHRSAALDAAGAKLPPPIAKSAARQPAPKAPAPKPARSGPDALTRVRDGSRRAVESLAAHPNVAAALGIVVAANALKLTAFRSRKPASSAGRLPARPLVATATALPATPARTSGKTPVRQRLTSVDSTTYREAEKVRQAAAGRRCLQWCCGLQSITASTLRQCACQPLAVLSRFAAGVSRLAAPMQRRQAL